MKNINITLIGDASSGKSTLLGHLLYQAGEINSQTIQKYEKEATSQGNAAQKFAYVCYTQQERRRGRTIDSCMRKIQTQEGFFTFFDTPGNQQKFKETIKSLTMVDVALLVVSAEQQATQLTSTTKEIIVAIYSLGIKQLIVAINKLDSSLLNNSFNQQRYNEVKQECLSFLRKVGFKENYVHFVPVSGFTGDNLTKKSDKKSWYEGKDLFSIIKEVLQPWRHIERPFRMPIRKIYNIQGVGVVIIGIVESGIV